jgi:hypothetical protein
VNLKEQIKKAASERRRAPEPFHVPAWNSQVFIRQLTAAQKDAFDASLVKVTAGGREQDMSNFRAKFLCACLENADGFLIFDSEDVTWLGEQPTADIDPIFRECQRVNGIGEDARKNSASPPGNGSTTS